MAGVEELVSPAGVVIDYPITPNCEGNEDDILQGSDFGPITRENSQQAMLLLGRLVHDRCSPMGTENSNAGITYLLCSVPPDIRAKIQPHLSPRMEKWKLLNLAVQEMQDIEGASELAPSSPGFYSCLLWGSVRPILDLSALNTPINCPSFTLGDSSVNYQGLRTRPMAYVPRFGTHLLSNCD